MSYSSFSSSSSCSSSSSSSFSSLIPINGTNVESIDHESLFNFVNLLNIGDESINILQDFIKYFKHYNDLKMLGGHLYSTAASSYDTLRYLFNDEKKRPDVKEKEANGTCSSNPCPFHGDRSIYCDDCIILNFKSSHDFQSYFDSNSTIEMLVTELEEKRDTIQELRLRYRKLLRQRNIALKTLRKERRKKKKVSNSSSS